MSDADKAKAFLGAFPADDVVAIGKKVKRDTFYKGMACGVLLSMPLSVIAMWVGYNVIGPFVVSFF